MSEKDEDPLPPTVKKVLDDYFVALRADPEIGDDDTDQLEALLRAGQIPQPNDLDRALFPLGEG